MPDRKTIRWTLLSTSTDTASNLARKHKVLISALIEYLIDKEDAVENNTEAPLAPWDESQRKVEIPQEYGQNFEKLLGRDGKKSSLAWLMVDDEEFQNSFNIKNGKFKFALDFVNKKTVKEIIEDLKYRRPDDFRPKMTAATVNQVLAILRYRGNLEWQGRDCYKVSPNGFGQAPVDPDEPDWDNIDPTDPANIALAFTPRA